MLDFQGLLHRARLRQPGSPDRGVLTTRLEAIFEEIARHIKPALAIEIGTHEAAWSRRLRAVLPDTRCLAFEANPAVAARALACHADY